MKTSLSLSVVLLLLAVTPAILGQAPAGLARQHSLSLSVEPLSTGASLQDTDKGRLHSVPVAHKPGDKMHRMNLTESQQASSSEDIQVTVRNFRPQSDTAQVEWYFIATPIHPGSNTPVLEEESIFDQGSQTVNLAANGTQVIPVRSKEIESSIKHTDQIAHPNHPGRGISHSEKETGATVGGWMVRVVADGRVIDATGSKAEYTDLVKDDTRLSAMKKK